MINLFVTFIVGALAFIGLTLVTQHIIHRIDGRRIKRDYSPAQRFDKSIRTIIDFQQQKERRLGKN